MRMYSKSEPMTPAEEFIFNLENHMCSAIDMVEATCALVAPLNGTAEGRAAWRCADSARDALQALLHDHIAAFEATFRAKDGDGSGGSGCAIAA